MDKNSNELRQKYLSGPVSKMVLRNIVPAMLSTLMMLIYNLADTFFIGLTHNDYMVAAVSLATPVFLIFMAIGTLFGVGGASVISRSLGGWEPGLCLQNFIVLYVDQHRSRSGTHGPSLDLRGSVAERIGRQ